jgi:hypothetical protein
VTCLGVTDYSYEKRNRRVNDLVIGFSPCNLPPRDKTGASNCRPSALSIMTPDTSTKPMTRAEKEAQSAAERLHSQIDSALVAVAIRSNSDREDLDASADRLERAARDLAAALRELAHERKVDRDSED